MLIQNCTKKIAILLPSLQVGGAEQLVIEELRYLQKDPSFFFEIHLLYGKGSFYEDLARLDLPIRVWNIPRRSIKTLFCLKKVADYLAANRFDIIHHHLLFYAGSLIGQLSRIKTIKTVHDHNHYSQIERLLIKHNDLVISCGEKVYENLIKFIVPSKLVVVNNAIKIPLYDLKVIAAIKSNLGIKSRVKVILTIGRLTKEKGFDVLIKAISEIIKSNRDIVLLIAGEGPECDYLKKMVESYSLKENIYLLGPSKNIHELLEICTVYINSSRTEGLPMTIIEAMAHAKPIIATAVGGNVELIIDQETGLLVEAESHIALANAIKTVLDNENLQKKIGASAYELFLDQYTINKHCDKLANIYLSL